MNNKKNETQKKKRDLFIKITRKKTKEQYEKRKEEIISEEGKKLIENLKLLKEMRNIDDIKKQEEIIKKQAEEETQKRLRMELKKITRSNANSAKIKVTLASMIGVFTIGGIGAGAVGQYALTSARENQKKEITVDASEYPNGVNVENIKSDRQVLLDGLDAREYVQKSIEQKMREKVTKEVDNLKNSDDVLRYLKEFYVNEYNKRNEEDITTDNVVLYIEFKDATGALYKLYDDVAENGDKIIRRTKKKDIVNGYTTDLISATVRDSENQLIKSEYSSYEKGVCTKVYGDDEQVEEYYDGCLEDVGNLIRQGLCYYAELDNDNEHDKASSRSIEAMSQYRRDLIDAITKYEQTDKHVKNQEDREIE